MYRTGISNSQHTCVGVCECVSVCFLCCRKGKCIWETVNRIGHWNEVGRRKDWSKGGKKYWGKVWKEIITDHYPAGIYTGCRQRKTNTYTIVTLEICRTAWAWLRVQWRPLLNNWIMVRMRIVYFRVMLIPKGKSILSWLQYLQDGHSSDLLCEYTCSLLVLCLSKCIRHCPFPLKVCPLGVIVLGITCI